MASVRKVALVTGSGKRRVGAVVAEALARRGYALVIHYHRSAVEAAESVAAFARQGIEAVALAADLTDESAVRALVSRSLAHFGRLDVLVNCAATWQPRRLEDVTAADVRGYLEANTL